MGVIDKIESKLEETKSGIERNVKNMEREKRRK